MRAGDAEACGDPDAGVTKDQDKARAPHGQEGVRSG